MALSTLSRSMRPCILGQRSTLPLISVRSSAPMSNTADDQMKAYWEKNLRLNRPNSPWIIYKPQLCMLSSLLHRTTGVGLGLALYGAGVGLALSPQDFTTMLEAVKAWDLGAGVWFPVKTFASFCVFFKCFSGSRHLWWDFRKGYEVREQNKSAYLVWGSSLIAALALSAAPYMM